MKYELIKTDFVIGSLGVKLFRIRRITTKELGGYIEKGENLAQHGDAWVSGDARVSGNARVEADTDIINVVMHPYSITFTRQNIAIGCQLRSRFGKEQWNAKDRDANPELIKLYKPLLNVLKKQLPRKKAA